MISMTAQILRVLLFVYLILIYAVSLLFLSRRKMSPTAYVLWGILALLLPAIGPFFLIAYRPGERKGSIRGSKGKKLSRRYRKSELT